MRILVLHRVPYFKIDYHRGVDHERHDVVYFGTRAALDTLPPGLRCERVERPGVAGPYREARAWLADRPRTFDRVISMSEYELLDAAELREWLGVAGASVQQVTLSRDKVVMKDAVRRAGLRVPRFLTLTEFLAGGGEAPWSGRTVLKPRRGASSVDVAVFENPARAYQAVVTGSTGVAALEAGQFEVEEFIDGPVRHFDGLVERGRVLAVGASEYLGTCLGYARGEPMGSYRIDCPDEVRRWVARALAAVRITDGSFHLEAIVPGGEPVFLEVGNRVGGADVVATFELATGIHLPSWELRILLGESVADALPAGGGDGRNYGWFVYPGHHRVGRFAGFDGADPFRAAPEVLTWTELAPDSPLPDHVTYGAGETALAGILATESPQRTRDWLRRLFDTLRLRTAELEEKLV